MQRKLTPILAAVMAISCLLPLSAGAQTETDKPQHFNGALGFRSIDAPLGGRYWFNNQKVGIDFGFGFGSTPAAQYDEDLMGWNIDVGVPFLVKSWDKVHILARPGLQFGSQEVETSSPPDPFTSDDATTFAVTAELEAEVFIASNFSVSAAHGIGYFQTSPAGGGDSSSSFSSTGSDFSHIGFHYYFFGGGH